MGQNTILVSMDVTSLYTNIPQEEGIEKHTKHTNAKHTKLFFRVVNCG